MVKGFSLSGLYAISVLYDFLPVQMYSFSFLYDSFNKLKCKEETKVRSGSMAGDCFLFLVHLSSLNMLYAECFLFISEVEFSDPSVAGDTQGSSRHVPSLVPVITQ